MRCVTGRAAFGLHRRVLKRIWSLLVDVALDASRISSRSEPGLPGFESAVRIVTVAAPHRAFQDFVMERHRKLGLHLIVTTGAELWIIRFQHASCREAGLLRIRGRRKKIRTRHVASDLV